MSVTGDRSMMMNSRRLPRASRAFSRRSSYFLQSGTEWADQGLGKLYLGVSHSSKERKQQAGTPPATVMMTMHRSQLGLWGQQLFSTWRAGGQTVQAVLQEALTGGHRAEG